MTVLSLQSLELRIADKLICSDLSLDVQAGESIGILGKNGVGKTTLLYSIAGLHPIESGKVLVQGTEISSLRIKTLARRVGILFQETELSMPATVLEYALLGRHPQASSLFWEAREDIEFTKQALSQMELSHLLERPVTNLSGGERQRLAIASLLAQAPNLYLLDEPSNHLDIDFQIRTLDTLRKRTREQSASIVMATHDINLAARYCERIVLLMGEGECLTGTASEILSQTNLSRAFACNIKAIEAEQQCYFFPA
jgi:iron complex transport system ATP-binding protein